MALRFGGVLAIDRQALDKLRELVGGEESDMVELVSSFLDEGPSIMETLAKSGPTSDLPATRRAAHSMKSNARDMGATELAEICAGIEARCAKGEPPDVEDIENARRAFNSAVAELQDIFHLGDSYEQLR
ncbi:Hpt domain-containing protein [Mesorhizobium sp. M4B.F.Ca.ET.190.01.1.1]|uniref:Hpt domain-containing protein n=1 Tax=unclassified Mesorhizobium TaxID=325217 RepID=UPI0010925719|nr:MULTISPECIES: Hpt domain-containing protein [unclassified Mesorhizobium]TGR00938.1 Hpt domain-containing protein [Mesorhizobium sp. M4B.F.Ca.ET.200.01.1.1]TGS12655.1 Hpt domain-containing protein [Mesorhizobium sp. M4B.F.Ca.ET.190.01.1.1]TGT25280.1 Hpt domain-containing protein [Mesorhizobium sp. M4B.F.Ca.ET.172.01.1.1]